MPDTVAPAQAVGTTLPASISLPQLSDSCSAPVGTGQFGEGDAEESEPPGKRGVGPRTGAREANLDNQATPKGTPRGGTGSADAPSDAIPMSPGARAFRDRVFPGATDADWADWKWQLRSRLRGPETLERAFHPTDDERQTVAELGDRLPVGITPYYASLIDPNDPSDPIRKTMVPVAQEFKMAPGEQADPLGEDADMPVPGLVHRYPDRVLFLVTSFCAVYCRYCTRSRLVGKTGEYHFNTAQFEKALAYLRATPEVRDVLISGGDPLTMNDDRLDWLLGQLRAIPHIDFVRIGSKVPVVLPQRITPAFCAMLKKHKPWMSIHFMHPREVTPEVAEACGRLVDAGVPLGSQTVLTAGVNDDPATMKELMHRLLKARVRPYYIYQCDPIPGSAHFRVPVEKGLEIIEALRGHTTGYAVPTFVIDGPGGGGKIPLMPNYVLGRDGDDIVLRNYSGKVFRYPDPRPQEAPVIETRTLPVEVAVGASAPEPVLVGVHSNGNGTNGHHRNGDHAIGNGANGHANGHTNGASKGRRNGQANGNGHANGHANGNANGQAKRGRKPSGA
ncbi:MAG: KamA family radical SAM protein [Phycisphaerales bacterium]